MTVPFIGRSRELTALRAALGRVQDGEPLTVLVHGASGMGKSTLVSRFLELARREGSLVFEGRCHEQEDVPYKALDRVVDGLAEHLLGLAAYERADLLPPDAHLLARVFPVFGRAVEREPTSGPDGPGRRRADIRPAAFSVLRHLLGELSSGPPLVVHIDDAQWTDADSALALRFLLRSPHPPRVLLVLTAREDAPADELEALLDGPAHERIGTRVERLEVGPLATEEAGRLAQVHLTGAGLDAHALVHRIVREASGVPVFLEQLAAGATPGGQAGWQAALEADPPDEPSLERIDTCAAAAVSIGMVDAVEGALYHARQLLLARQAGEPKRVWLAETTAAGYRVVLGGGAQYASARAELEETRAAAERTGDDETVGSIRSVEAIAAFQVGRWRDCLEHSTRTLELLGERRGTGGMALQTAESYWVAAAIQLGQLRAAVERFGALLTQARARSDLYMEVLLRVGVTLHPLLLQDAAGEAADDVEGALRAWPTSRYSAFHCYADRALAQIDLFRGRARQAAERMETSFPRLCRSTVGRARLVRDMHRELLVRALLAAERTRPGGLRRARLEVRRLRRAGLPWTDALAALADAQVLVLRDGPGEPGEAFAHAGELCAAAELGVHEQAARWRAGEAGDPKLVESARAWLEGEGAENPEALVRMLAPVGPA